MNLKSSSISSKIFDLCNYLFMILLAFCILYPYIYMFSISISDPTQVALLNVKFLPKGFTLNAYLTVLKDKEVLNSYYNSIVYTTFGTILTILFSSLSGYVLSSRKFRAQKFFSIVFVIPMVFSGGMIPTYLNMANLNLIDTIWAIVLPPAFGMWYITLMRSSFATIPESLSESAFLDGANDWKIYYRIIMPLSKPIIATIAIFASVQYWNAYFPPLLYLTSPQKMPLSILLRRILVANEILSGAQDQAQSVSSSNSLAFMGQIISLRMATIFLTIGPIVLVYPFAQKYFINGITVGAVKG